MEIIIMYILPTVNQKYKEKKMESFFNKYHESYKIYNDIMNKNLFNEIYGKNDYLYNIIHNYGGTVFKKGLFKIHTFDSIHTWTKKMSEYFLKETVPFNITCFASNWQGMMFCVDHKNETIIYFDPLKNTYFRKNIPIEHFFTKTLIDANDDIISEKHFDTIFQSMKIIELDYVDSITKHDNSSPFSVINTELLWETLRIPQKTIHA
jgi:hypothetical protein